VCASSVQDDLIVLPELVDKTADERVTNQSHGALQGLTDGALAVDGSDIRSCAAASWNVRLATSQRP